MKGNINRWKLLSQLGIESSILKEVQRDALIDRFWTWGSQNCQMQFVCQRSIRPSCNGMTIQGQTHPELRLSYYWEEICEKEASHTTNAKWLDLRVDHSNLPEKKPAQHPKGRHPTMSLRHEGQDTTRTWHDLHLLCKEARCMEHCSLHGHLASGYLAASAHTRQDFTDPHKGTAPSDYPSWTCLHTAWMLFSVDRSQHVSKP